MFIGSTSFLEIPIIHWVRKVGALHRMKDLIEYVGISEVFTNRPFHYEYCQSMAKIYKAEDDSVVSGRNSCVHSFIWRIISQKVIFNVISPFSTLEVHINNVLCSIFIEIWCAIIGLEERCLLSLEETSFTRNSQCTLFQNWTPILIFHSCCFCLIGHLPWRRAHQLWIFLKSWVEFGRKLA